MFLQWYKEFQSPLSLSAPPVDFNGVKHDFGKRLNMHSIYYHLNGHPDIMIARALRYDMQSNLLNVSRLMTFSFQIFILQDFRILTSEKIRNIKLSHEIGH